jgi:hypothetical protein
MEELGKTIFNQNDRVTWCTFEQAITRNTARILIAYHITAFRTARTVRDANLSQKHLPHVHLLDKPVGVTSTLLYGGQGDTVMLFEHTVYKKGAL